ncbi:type I polyketide synthase [Streptomyces vinaceus]
MTSGSFTSAGPQGEPIAVVGMGCRFAAGVASPQAFWQLLIRGGDGIVEVPASRWAPFEEHSPQERGVLRAATRHAAYMDDIEGFDAAFFGIAPREAVYADPQQRLVLEVAWEALEHAGIPAAQLRGTDAGVYLGVTFGEYGLRTMTDLTDIQPWAGMGTAYYAVPNRVSYLLDLRGPSLAVDAACASSLYGVHLACQSLWAGESSLMLAGGVSVLSAPHSTVALDAMGATAPDGRSKSFSADADGYGRGEGAGIVVLKRLGDALAAGDRIWAVIRSSVVQHDGKTDAIMIPGREAQEDMLRTAYRRAGISPRLVDYIEAHGTGTPVGDPIEAAALGAVVGAERPGSHPCLIGSVKPNIGHLEAGAGVAGLIKSVLAVHHAQIPASLYCQTPNPAVDWETAGLRVATSLTAWPETGRPRRAGVSCYGYGGAIAHLVLEQAPAGGEPEHTGHGTHDVPQGAPVLFPVSGASAAARAGNAERLADWLEAHPAACLACVGHTLARRRNHLPYRAGIVADTPLRLVSRLRRLQDGESMPGLTAGAVQAGRPAGAVWVFSGHGAQWNGMGRELLAAEPVFAAAIDELGPVFQEELGVTARQALLERDLTEVETGQPVTYAMHIALAALWRSRGVTPAAVIGHSLGEIAAAVTAGALTAADGARVVCRRARLLRRAEGYGAMALVGLPFTDVQARLGGRQDVVAAIHASPESAVISGDEQAVADVSAQWAAEGLLVLRVNTSLAFHSPHMDELVEDTVKVLAGIPARTPSVTCYTSTLEDPRSTAARDGAFWGANMRNPCRFAPAVEAALADGHRVFLEVSAHPLVTNSLSECLTHHGADDGVVAHTLRRGHPEQHTFLENLALLHCNGTPVGWERLHPAGDLLELPANAWQHEPYWAQPPAENGYGGHDPKSHTLLGTRHTIGGEQIDIWRTRLDQDSRPYPGQHPVHGVEIVPAAVLLATFLATGSPEQPVRCLTDITLRTPVAVTPPREVLVVRRSGTVKLVTRLADESGSGQEIDTWLTHTTAGLSFTGTPGTEPVPDYGTVRERCHEPFTGSIEEWIASLGAGGIGFPWHVVELQRGEGEMTAHLALRNGRSEAVTWATLFDAALTLTPMLLPDDGMWRMPSHVSALTVATGTPPTEIHVVARRHPHSPADSIDVWISTPDGHTLAIVTQITFGILEADATQVTDPRRLVHSLAWRPLPLPETPGSPLRQVILVGRDDDLARRLTTACPAQGLRFTHLRDPEELQTHTSRLTVPTAVIAAPGLPDETADLSEHAVQTLWTLTRTAQWLAAHHSPGTARLWCLTRGVRHARSLASVTHAPLWGAGRVIANEHPELWGATIDAETADTGQDIAPALLRILHTAPSEDLLSLTGSEIQAPRLTPAEPAPGRTPLTCRPQGTYLITGGLGSLGLEAARWLTAHGARRLVLAGRTPLRPREQWPTTHDPAERARIDTITELEALGVTVHTLALDIADLSQARHALSAHTLNLPPIRGIVHAAGTLEDRLIDHLDEQSLRTVMRPKTGGALTLHTLFPPGTLDFFFSFSSCGQLFQVPGQTSYAGANSFLDALATHRAHHGDTVTSLAWTGWRDQGMAAAARDAYMHVMQAQGTTDITTAQALTAWDLAARTTHAYLAILPILPMPPGTTRLPVFSELHPTTAADRSSPTADSNPPDWAHLAPDEARGQIQDIVTQAVATEMQLPARALDTRRPLVEMGIDSILTMKIRGTLQRRTGIRLPANLLWQHPTIRAVTTHIYQVLTARRDDSSTPPPSGTLLPEEPK